MKSQSLLITTMIVMFASLLSSCSSSPLNKQQDEAIVYPPDDYHHPPLVNLSLFRYHINSTACQDNDKPIQVVIMVKTHVGNQNKRHQIRAAYSAAMLEALGIRRVFVVAMLNNDTENNKKYKSISTNKIAEESRSYGDLIQINYIERYEFLTYKTLMGMKWVVTNCKAKFLVAQDDDVIVDVFQLKDRIQALKGKDKNSMYGFLNDEYPVGREGNHYVTREQYAPIFYPDFLSGIFQFYSLDTAKLLLNNAENFIYINNEDVFISGVIAEKVGLKRIHMNGIIKCGTSLNCCRDKTSDVIFQCENIAVEMTSPPSLVQVMEWSRRVEQCHVTNQCKPFQESRKFTHLVCV